MALISTRPGIVLPERPGATMLLFTVGAHEVYFIESLGTTGRSLPLESIRNAFPLEGKGDFPVNRALYTGLPV